MNRFPLLFAYWVLLFSSFLSAHAAAFVPVSHSVLPARNGASGDSSAPVMTPDARFVLFASTANNLATAPNGSPVAATFPVCINTYVRDRQAEPTRLVSVNVAGGGAGNGDSLPLAISTNGRFALFTSSAANLVNSDTNGVKDIFLRDLEENLTTLVTVSTNGRPADGESEGAIMTPDGRFIAFISKASNLVPNDTNGVADVFVRDLLAATTTVASVQIPFAAAVLIPGSPEISDDGRYVAFAVYKTGGTPFPYEVCVRDLAAETTLVASSGAAAALLSAMGSTPPFSFGHALSANGNYVALAVNPSNKTTTGLILRYSIASGLTDIVHTNALTLAWLRGDSREADMTPDGRFIAFLARTNSYGTNTGSVRVWDAQNGTSVLASVDPGNKPAIGDFGRPALDPTGRFVVFTSTAANLTTNALLPGSHLYLRDLLLGTTELLDADAGGLGLGVAPFTFPRLSQDGQYVSFQGVDPEAPKQSLANWQVLLRNRALGQTELVSARHSNMPSATGIGSSHSSPAVSQDGRYVAFASLSPDLAPNDTNGNWDVFLRDIREGITVLLSKSTNAVAASGMSYEPCISADGRFIAFTSTAADIAPGDTNKFRDVFVHDRQTQTTVLASRKANGFSGNNASSAPRVNAAGTALAFLSKATDLASVTPGTTNLFWRNLETQTTIALTTSGALSYAASGDGRYLAFAVPGYLYLWDSASQSRIYTNSSPPLVLAVSPDGNRIAGNLGGLEIRQRIPSVTLTLLASYSPVWGDPAFSGNGDYLLYLSTSVQGFTDTNGTRDVYLYHVPSQSKLLVSHAWNSAAAANGASSFPVMSPDARLVVYTSAATNIVPGDTNAAPDVFVYDRSTGQNRLLGAGLVPAMPVARTTQPVFSADGRTIVFPSWRSDLVSGDCNQAADLFGFDFLHLSIDRSPMAPHRISWPVLFGLNYQAEFVDQLDGAEWQALDGDIVITNGIGAIEDSTGGAEQKFYRVIAY